MSDLAMSGMLGQCGAAKNTAKQSRVWGKAEPPFGYKSASVNNKECSCIEPLSSPIGSVAFVYF